MSDFMRFHPSLPLPLSLTQQSDLVGLDQVLVATVVTRTVVTMIDVVAEWLRIEIDYLSNDVAHE